MHGAASTVRVPVTSVATDAICGGLRVRVQVLHVQQCDGPYFYSDGSRAPSSSEVEQGKGIPPLADAGGEIPRPPPLVHDM